MQKLLRKQRQFRLLKKVTKKLQKLARLEREQEKESKKARETFWKFTHWSIAVMLFTGVIFSYGTFFPNTVSTSKIQHKQHHEYFNKLNHKEFFLIDKFSCSFFYKKLITKKLNRFQIYIYHLKQLMLFILD